MALSRADIEARCRLLDGAETDDFAMLARLVDLDKTRNFRGADWSDVSFRQTDIRGFDFTAARLHGCDFTGARIAGARFDQAELGAVWHRGRDDPRAPARMTGIANLRAAADWADYVASFADPKRWRPPAGRLDPSHLPVGAIFSDAPGLAPEMVVVPAGTFLMGSPDGSGGDNGERAEEGRYEDEGPCRRIAFDRPFAIGRFAVTVAEFRAFAASPEGRRRKRGGRDGPRKASAARDDSNPATDVNWAQAVAYCEWLNARLGLAPDTYRMPSESEWEYSARAGTDGPFWWDGPISPEKANFTASRVEGDSRDRQAGRRGVVPVKTYDPNPWGLYQAHGNVWEWCRDVYEATLDGVPADGSARSREDDTTSLRVLRGGSWYSSPRALRSAGRGRDQPVVRVNVVGFRVARTL
jgi:formylglycine-generating enzyme required for sulfatase activity